jgi:hypothetical protein
MIWARPQQATGWLEEAARMRPELDDTCLDRTAHELMAYELEFGSAEAGRVAAHLATRLNLCFGAGAGRRLLGRYHLARAFNRYWSGHLRETPQAVGHALLLDPRNIGNLGAWSILVRSAIGGWLRAGRTPTS